jgi:uncharacterized protein YbjT (DUF2867 family)
MRVLVTGSSGLVGTELISQLEALGHSVVRWKRGTVVSGQDLETVDADWLQREFELAFTFWSP